MATTPMPNPNTVVQLTRSGSILQCENGPITAQHLADQALLDPADQTMGYYLHVPFCFHKCHYCDFFSIVDTRDRQGVFADRLITDMRSGCALGLFQPADTIFIGGGTPTLLAEHLWQRLLPAVAETLQFARSCEFTVEANPETVTASLMNTLASGGVNRISIGAQSFNHAHLKTLERWHDPANVGRSMQLAREAGIRSINIDLIFAITGQSLDDWLRDLHLALALEPDHISCYGLTYEPNTPMTAKLRAGRFEPAEQDLEAAMYRAAVDQLKAAGFEHYEISAWARPGHRCRHNLRYWSNRDWWPLGPSASGHINGTRWKNIHRLSEYLPGDACPPITDVERLDEDGRVGEILMLGLRLIDGIDSAEVDQLLRRGDRGASRAAAIEMHRKRGLLQRAKGRLRLTDEGLLLADSVLADLV